MPEIANGGETPNFALNQSKGPSALGWVRRFCANDDGSTPLETGTHVQSWDIGPGTQRHGNIRWAFDATSINNISQEVGEAQIVAATALWSAACPFFSFSQRHRGDPDVDVLLRADPAGGDNQVDGIAARGKLDGVQYDPAETWPTTSDFFGVTLHELGHVLGLGHSTDPNSIMYPIGFPALISAIDKGTSAEINARYGWEGPVEIAGGSSWGSTMCDSGADFIRVWCGAKDDFRLYIGRSANGLDWHDVAEIPQRGSQVEPAICGYIEGGHRKLFMMWRGIEGDEELYWAVNEDPTKLAGFNPQQKVPNGRSPNRPTLAWTGHSILAAWREDDQSIWWSEFRDGTWKSPNSIPWVGTYWGPSLAVIDHTAYLFWGGKEQDAYKRTWMATLYLGAFGVTDLSIWTQQQEVLQIQTVQSPDALPVSASLIGVDTQFAPTVCVREGLIYLTYQSTNGARLTALTPVVGKIAGITGPMAWNGSIEVPLPQYVSFNIGMAAKGGQLVLACRGPKDDRKMYAVAIG